MTATKTLLAAAILGFSVPAVAQDAPASPPAAAAGAPAGVAAGATVKDAQGGVVGTIDSITPTGAVVNTGTVKATLGLSSFAPTPTGPIISLTKAQLEAQVQQATAAALDQALKVGAVVHGPQGAPVGTVESITGDQVVVTTTGGKAKAQLARSAFAADAGGLVIGMTQAQLEAAVAAASTGGAAAPKPAAAPGG